MPIRALAILAVAVLAWPRPSQAQEQPNALGWDAFIGCWQPEASVGPRLLTCFLPADDASRVQRLTVVADTVAARQVLAFGERATTTEDCSGTIHAQHSVDGARVYLRESLRCGTVDQLNTGILTITPDGDLLQVHAVAVGAERALNLERMHAVAREKLPVTLQEMLAPTELRVRGARVAAAKVLTVAQIEDAVRHVDGVAVEAWMAEVERNRSGFRATRRDLERLVAAKAPERVIDMTVVVSNPEHFQQRVERVVGESSGGAFGGTFADGFSRGFGSFCRDGLGVMPWAGYGFWNPWMMPMGGSYGFSTDPQCSLYSYYSRSALNPFGFGYFGPGMFPGNGFFPRRVVVTPVAPGTPRELGRVEKGVGRRAPSASGSGSAQPRTPPATTATVRQPSSSAGSSSSGRTRTESGSGTGRTAQPRPSSRKP